MKRIATIFILLLILAIPTSAAFAEGIHDEVVESGETIDDDLVILSGNLDINEGATVTGDVIVMSGNAHIAGTVEGDIVLFSGNMETTETAVIEGDCVLLSGNFTDMSNNITCTNVSSEFPAALDDLPNISIPDFNAPPDVNVEIRDGGFIGNVLGAFGSSVLLGILAFVIASFAPRQLGRSREAVQTKTVVSGTVGLLTAVAIPSLIAILAPISAILILACGIGLLGFPIIIALAVGLAAGAVFGWITIGSLFGQKLTQWLNISQSSLPLLTALGTAALTFVINLLDIIPYVPEGLLGGIIMCVGLGATALTHFGTKTYPRLNGPAIAGGPIENSAKVTAVFDTLPPEDPANLK
ncbi:MAG: polymer-forming cytoskeletal protein [Ardenticatenaceae bacterium]|nr:polymer-forming cytoskeletal protein [Ardenticatenaceae bacterium]